MKNRKDVREALATLLDASGNYQAVYDYPRKNLRGDTPVALVISVGVGREFASEHLNINNFYLLVLHILRRDTTNVEDVLDNLEEGLAQILRDNYQTSDWDLIEYEPSGNITVDYGAVVDNDPAIVERILVRIKVTE